MKRGGTVKHDTRNNPLHVGANLNHGTGQIHIYFLTFLNIATEGTGERSALSHQCNTFFWYRITDNRFIRLTQFCVCWWTIVKMSVVCGVYVFVGFINPTVNPQVDPTCYFICPKRGTTLLFSICFTLIHT